MAERIYEEYETIEALSKEFQVKELCELAGVSRSGYYKWRKRDGATKQGDIATRVGIETASKSRYLATLLDLGIVNRVYPFGENPATSRRGLYRIAEGSFSFWFKFVMPRTYGRKTLGEGPHE